MKIERTKNATRNIVFGIIYRMEAILCPFIVRTVMLYIMGTEYVGLNSLFTSILSFLSLAELGVGSALVYSMYKPIAENDTDSICALLNLYRKLYRYIGLIIFCIGMILVPFLPKLISGDVPVDINLYILYFIYLFNNVISYWLYGYKQSLLTAFQRTDIISKRSMIIQMGMYVIQIAVLLIFRNYYVYIIWLPISTIATNVANSIIVDKMFPNYKCRGEVPKDVRDSITKKVMALFGTKANSIVLHSADNLVISAFLGLIMVGLYGNYYYILNSIMGIITIIFSSLTAGLGNSLETETREKNYEDFLMIFFLNAWLVTFCTVSLLCLYQPFMKIWVGESNMLSFDIVVLFACYFYLFEIQHTILTYKDAAGIWWEDRFRPYVMMVTNIVLNIFLVQVIGIYGIVISTIISIVVSIPWVNYTAFKYIFKQSSIQYYKRFFLYLLLAVVLCFLTYSLCRHVSNGVIGLLIRALICLVVPNLSYITLFYKTNEFKRILGITQRYVKRRK